MAIYRKNPNDYPLKTLSTFGNLENFKMFYWTLNSIEWYMVGMAVASCTIFIGLFIYFPDKPPSQPSTTSTIPRTGAYSITISHVKYFDSQTK